VFLRPPPEEVARLTSAATHPRLADGRPAVPEALLERLAGVSTEEAWDTLRKNGYHHQFEAGWFQTHPSRVLVGRVVTALMMPYRPDLDELVQGIGAAEGFNGRQNAWVIETLEVGDVMVVDFYGKIAQGTFIGDNLGTSLREHTRAGAVIDGAIRDLPGIASLDQLSVFCRGVHPTAIADATLVGLNVPIRIGGVTVLPGDVVLGTQTGVTFIPAHLVELVVERSELTRMRDAFSHERLRQQTYTPSQLDREDWSEAIMADFEAWRGRR
jgi:4-hydroxy-4-methyl-2-oxoglutarate aldolase